MRPHIINVRLSPEEHATLHAAARAAGMSMSALLRSAIMDEVSVAHPPVAAPVAAPSDQRTEAQRHIDALDAAAERILANAPTIAPSDGATAPDPDDLSDMDSVDWSTDAQD